MPEAVHTPLPQPPHPPQLWLLRHAQPLIAPGHCYGQFDVPADAAATHAAVQHWASALPAGAVLRHSPLQRCAQLAQGLHPAPIADARLQEMHFGAWEGRAWADIAAEEIDAWAHDLARTAPGGGEPLAAMLQRVQSALAHTWRHDSQHGTRDVVWVTHAGTIRCVQWLLQRGTQHPSSADWVLPAPAFGHALALPWADHGPALQALAGQR